MELQARELRSRANRVGWSMLLYTALLFFFSFAEIFLRMLVAIIVNGVSLFLDMNSSVMEDALMDAAGSGIGSILAAVASVGLLALIFRKVVPMRDVWQKDRKLSALSFGKVFVVFMAFQFLFSLVSLLIELGLNVFGLTSMEALEAVSGSSDSWSMLLYVGIVAPFAEEIVYRGFVLRGLSPYGKKLAIIASALLFGAAHGNIYQFMYATAVGLVLGYVATEYSIWWAIVLHLINNLFFANIWDRVLGLYPEQLQLILSWGLEAVFFVLAMIVLIRHRAEARQGLLCSKEERGILGFLFRSDGVIFFVIVQAILAVWTMVMLISPL